MINTKLLKEKMEERNLNLSKLSIESGVDRGTLCRILNISTKSCTIDTADKISKALKLSPKESIAIFFAK